MIKSFSDKETEKIWNQVYSKKIPNDIQPIVLRKLFMIHRAIDVNDLRVPPGNRLEKLTGNLKSYHSIRVNQQWRLIFIWKNNNAEEVKLLDYH